MTLNWPQITWLLIACLTLVMAAALDGKPRGGHHRFGLNLISFAFSAWLLWCGGFFG